LTKKTIENNIPSNACFSLLTYIIIVHIETRKVNLQVYLAVCVVKKKNQQKKIDLSFQRVDGMLIKKREIN